MAGETVLVVEDEEDIQDMKGVYASATYFLTEQETGSQDEHDILQADLIFKF